ncbi:MAG: peptide deformylase [Clostridia bacterium]|nr:peptide deformylase [Clostridia bacterium]
MAILNILKEGDPVLRKRSREVEEITPRIKTLIDDMVETLHRANGCGLAAPQVGILRRVVIVETEPGVIYKMINPEIIAMSGNQEEAEGCLSIPGKWGITKRPAKVTVRATGIDGRKFEITGEGLLARAFCHELDHLDGKLFTDCTVRMLDPDEVE